MLSKTLRRILSQSLSPISSINRWRMRRIELMDAKQMTILWRKSYSVVILLNLSAKTTFKSSSQTAHLRMTTMKSVKTITIYRDNPKCLLTQTHSFITLRTVAEEGNSEVSLSFNISQHLSLRCSRKISLMQAKQLKKRMQLK